HNDSYMPLILLFSVLIVFSVLFFHVVFFFFLVARHFSYLLSFPTRRSSDLSVHEYLESFRIWEFDPHPNTPAGIHRERQQKSLQDRKSTRLNSSHVSISYAVFCLKKKIS